MSLEFFNRFNQIENRKPLGEFVSISTKSKKPQDCTNEIWEHYSIHAFDETGRPVFEPASAIKSNKYIVDESCILISKLNPATKRIWWPTCETKNAVCSTEFIVFQPNKRQQKSFYYAAVDDPQFTDYLLGHITGSTGSRQRAQPKAALNYLVADPGDGPIEDFCRFADPAYLQIRENAKESQRLERLRDTLLPKLMSGEIDVSRVDITQLNNHLEDPRCLLS